MYRLFAGRKEGIRINVENGLGPGTDGQGLGGHVTFVGADMPCPYDDTMGRLYR